MFIGGVVTWACVVSFDREDYRVSGGSGGFSGRDASSGGSAGSAATSGKSGASGGVDTSGVGGIGGAVGSGATGGTTAGVGGSGGIGGSTGGIGGSAGGSAGTGGDAAQDAFVMITDVDDATVAQDVPTTPLGLNTMLDLVPYPASNEREVLIRPRALGVPANATIVQALLNLTCSASGAPGDVWLIAGAWAEATVTWNTAPAASSYVLATFQVSSTTGATYIDLTTIYQNWVNGDPANGVYLSTRTGSPSTGCWSHEYGNGPTFLVTYH